LKRSLITAFLAPASIAILEQRLRKRGTDTEEDVRKRLSVAREEIAQWKLFDYLIISTTIAEDLRRMECILEAERMRPCRAQPPEV
jgi:guanylate kinase